MVKIAFHIQKGGVGKTTLSGNVAYNLALKGKKIVMIDADQQGNLSSWFLHTLPEFELADILNKKTDAEKALVPINENLCIIPTFGIGGSLKKYAETALVYEPQAFNKLCVRLQQLNFDYAIFDLSPGMSLLEKNIIAVMDEVITPLTPAHFSIDGIEIFNYELSKINDDFSKQVKHKKIILNMFNNSFREHNIIRDKMMTLNYTLYTIGQDRKLAESQTAGQSIFQYYASSKTIPEFDRLTGDIIERR
ncbi:MAG: ParA family protein [Brevinematales bacterium]|jgi:cellulose biosynthesis protein BcsQ